MRTRVARSLLTFTLLGIASLGGRPALADVVTFNDLPLDPNSFFNGPDPQGTVVDGPFGPTTVGSFTSGGATFANNYQNAFKSWGGFAYSNTSDTTTPGYLNQYSAYPGRGADPVPNDNYAVAFGFHDLVGNATGNDPFNPGDAAQLLDLPHLTIPTGSQIVGLDVTNTTYAALSMLRGDSFAKKFGGPSGNDPDYFLLSAYGIDASGHVLANHVDFYLADYRFADNSLDYIVKTWTFLDLSSLAGASTIAFNVSSSDVGQFGLNTPGYFAADDIRFTTAAVPEPASLALAAIGLVGLAAASWRRKARPDPVAAD